jgi:hypothetical protein
VKSLLHRARATLAHQASLPAFAAPFIARLARVRPGQVVVGLIAEQTTGVAAIAALALAGTNALGSIHVGASPQAPTAAQAQAALGTAAQRPLTAPPPPSHRPRGCSTLGVEYQRCEAAAGLGGAALPGQ